MIRTGKYKLYLIAFRQTGLETGKIMTINIIFDLILYIVNYLKLTIQ